MDGLVQLPFVLSVSKGELIAENKLHDEAIIKCRGERPFALTWFPMTTTS